MLDNIFVVYTLKGTILEDANVSYVEDTKVFKTNIDEAYKEFEKAYAMSKDLDKVVLETILVI